MTEIAIIDWFGRWGTSVFSESTAIFISDVIKWIYSAFILKRSVAFEFWFLKIHSLILDDELHSFLSLDINKTQ